MDAQSPVMFMIDDFANVWVDKNENNKLDKGEDWGTFVKIQILCGIFSRKVFLHSFQK